MTVCFCARLERHPLEAAQAAHRLRDARDGVVDVELDDVVALAVAGVGDVHRHGDLAVLRHALRAQVQVVDGERRVAQPEAERVERVARRRGRGSASCTSSSRRTGARSARGCSRSAPGPSARGNDTGSLPPGLTLPNSTSATALPASMPGNQASRIAGEDAATFDSVSGRPLKSTTTNGLPGRLDRVDELLLLARAGRCRCATRPRRSARGSRRAPARPGRRPFAAATAAAKPASEPHSSAGVLSGGSLSAIVQPCGERRRVGLCALMPSKTRHGVRVVALAPPRAEHVVLVVAERADHGGRLGGVERQRRRRRS